MGSVTKLQNEVFCSTCGKLIPQGKVVSYDGGLFHHSCFREKVEDESTWEHTPSLSFQLPVKTVKGMLDTLEAWLLLNPENKVEAKKYYADLAIRLAHAGKGFAVCNNCGKCRRASQMFSFEKLRKAYINMVGVLCRKTSAEYKEAKATVYLFCKEDCGKNFFKGAAKKLMEGNKEALARVLGQTPKKEEKPKDEKPAEPEIVVVKHECAECNKKEAETFCPDLECDAWLCRGECMKKHKAVHEAEQEAKDVERHEEWIIELKTRLFEQPLESLREARENVDIAAKTKVNVGNVRIERKEWADILDDVIEVVEGLRS